MKLFTALTAANLPLSLRWTIAVASLSFVATSANASAVIDLDTNKVYRINDSTPVVLVIHGTKYAEVEDFNQINPAGVRGKRGYATERQIDGENILNQNKGIKNGIITPWFIAGSLDTNKYSAKAMLNYVRNNGISGNQLSHNALKVMSNYQEIKTAFDNKSGSKSRSLGGPNKRGQFEF